MDGLDGAVITHGVAAVDDFLATPLHFRVFPLHRGEVQILSAFARSL